MKMKSMLYEDYPGYYQYTVEYIYPHTYLFRLLHVLGIKSVKGKY